MWRVYKEKKFQIKKEVVVGCGLTVVKIFMRLWLQKFVSPVNPQPFVRVEYRNLKK